MLAASPSVRATLRDWLGIGSVRIARVQSLPDISPARQLELGRRATVAQANAHLGSPIATVRALGAPAAIYIDDVPPPRVSVVYAARPGLPPGVAGVGALLDEIQGDATRLHREVRRRRRADHARRGSTASAATSSAARTR